MPIRSVLLFLCGSLAFSQAPSDELNTLLMHATFRIFGPDAKRAGISFGTVFFMGRPIKGAPQSSYAVLVTAAHVMDSIKGDHATLTLRRRNADGTYVPFDYPLNIRSNGQPLYTKHEHADVAVMYTELPRDVPISVLPPSFLADDKRIEEIEIHPGDQVLYLGFPLFAMSANGFPLLRGGILASYPLTPAKSVGEWNFDGLVSGGSSGGPVYFHYENRIYKGGIHVGYEQGILGLVIEEVNSSIPDFAAKPLNYGVIVPAQLIKEAVDLLPEAPAKKDFVRPFVVPFRQKK